MTRKQVASSPLLTLYVTAARGTGEEKPHLQFTATKPNILFMRTDDQTASPLSRMPAGETQTQLVSNVNFAPAFAELAETAPPTKTDGRCLVTLLSANPHLHGERRCSWNPVT